MSSRIGTTRNVRAVSSENQPRIGKTAALGQVNKNSVLQSRRALAPSSNVNRITSTANVLASKSTIAGGKGDLKGDLKKAFAEKVSKLKANDENACVPPKGEPVAGDCRSKPLKEQFKIEESGFSNTCLLPKDVEDIDSGDGDNVLLASEYVSDIYRYLKFLEEKQTVSPNFMNNQKEMTPKMRSVLVDWMVNVHHQFKLLPETLYMAVSIMDRFFQKESVCKDKIQLVGVTAFFISSKFEEIYPPELSDFVTICEKLYSKRDILKMEMVMLRMLKFELGRPLPIHFLRRFSKAAHADPKLHTLAKYLMELTLLSHTCSSWTPSLLAATAMYVTLKVLEVGDPTTYNGKWTSSLAFYSGYTEQQLQPYASQLCKLMCRGDFYSRYPNIRRKYASAKLMRISDYSELSCTWVQEMAGKGT